MTDILIKLYENGILEITGVVNYFFRAVAWFLVVVLAKLVNGIETAVNKIYTLNNFFNSSEVIELIDKYKPLVWSILGLSIAVLGYRIIFYKKKGREDLPANIIFSILVVVLLPTFMVKIGQITELGIISNTETTSANKLIKDNVYDMYYLDQDNFTLTGDRNNISEDNILNLSINETVDDGNVKNKDLFKSKLVIDESGQYKKDDLDKGWFTIDEDYYRYNTDFLILIIALSTTGVTLLCVGLKVARLIFELAFNKIFAILMAFADIESGQRVRSIIKHIISIFIVIFTTSILLKLYILFTTWLNSSLGKVDIGLGFNADNLAKIIIQLGASIAVIDGPNIVERILGIDAGLKSGWGALATGYGLAKGTKGMLSGALKGATNGGALLAGAGAGLSSNLSSAFSNNTTGSTNTQNKNDKNQPNLQSEMNKEKANAFNNNSDVNDSKNNTVSDNIQESEKNDHSKDITKINPNNPDSTSQNLQSEMDKNKMNSNSDNKQPTLQAEMNKNGLNNNSNNPENKQSNLQSDIDKNKMNSNTANKQPNLQAEMDKNGLSSNSNNPENKQSNLQSDIDNNKMNSNSGNKQSDLQSDINKNGLNNNSNNPENKQSNLQSDIDKNNKNTTNPNLQSEINNNDNPNTNNKVENSTLGGYIKNKFNSNGAVQDIKRSYNMGKNTTSKWTIPDNKDKNIGKGDKNGKI